ncbi:putative reverse transcriptase domain-containing protein [Tanacetum coccineum]
MNFSKIAKPLASLTQKNWKYEWGREREEAFQTLKDNLCNAPILSLPDGPEDFVVYYDASNQGLGCVLLQRGKSSTHIRSEGVIYAPTKWIELFSDFDMEIRYHPRKANVVADALSEASKVENAIAEMLHGMDQLIERKEDGVFDVPFGALHRRKCRSPVLWAEIRESRLVRPELVQETIDKVVLIKEKLKAARDHQKSYADNRCKLLEFEVEDQVLLKVSPWKGVVHLERKTC